MGRGSGALVRPGLRGPALQTELESLWEKPRLLWSSAGASIIELINMFDPDGTCWTCSLRTIINNECCAQSLNLGAVWGIHAALKNRMRIIYSLFSGGDQGSFFIFYFLNGLRLRSCDLLKVEIKSLLYSFNSTIYVWVEVRPPEIWSDARPHF